MLICSASSSNFTAGALGVFINRRRKSATTADWPYPRNLASKKPVSHNNCDTNTHTHKHFNLDFCSTSLLHVAW